MTLGRHGRWRGPFAALLCGVLAGCASGAQPEPAAPSTSPSSAGVDGSDGVATRSDDHPRWQPIHGLHVPRDDFGTAVIGPEVWAMGGMTGDRGNRLVSIEVLDTRSGRWRTSRLEMPVGLASFETVALGRHIYGFGGFDKESRPTAFAAVLDTATGRWRDL
ncbi:MAG TPA: kelch repeat-containing protein, partial [Nocardioides sp.]|nr:kelch repeat-containing protein [Nocardioides sp.]